MVNWWTQVQIKCSQNEHKKGTGGMSINETYRLYKNRHLIILKMSL